jgi:ABC-type glutathione transport system ATPase component
MFHRVIGVIIQSSSKRTSVNGLTSKNNHQIPSRRSASAIESSFSTFLGSSSSSSCIDYSSIIKQQQRSFSSSSIWTHAEFNDTRLIPGICFAKKPGNGGGGGGGSSPRTSNPKGEGISGKYVFHTKDLGKRLPNGKILFENLNFSLYYGAKIGVLGSNGAGKSSLLKILAGIDMEYDGDAEIVPGIKVGYLPQEPKLDPELDVRGNVLEGVKEKMETLKRFEELTELLNKPENSENSQLQKEKSELETIVEEQHLQVSLYSPFLIYPLFFPPFLSSLSLLHFSY